MSVKECRITGAYCGRIITAILLTLTATAWQWSSYLK